MSINLKSNKKTTNQSGTQNSNIIELLFFIALNALVIPFSAYQTYVGYRKDVVGGNPEETAILAIIVAAISGVLFAAMNFGIRDSRLKGEKHLLKVLMYVVPFGLSFFANFNAFYSNQMKDNLLRSEVNNYKYILTQTKEISVKEIRKSVDIEGFETKFNQKWNDLKTEFTEAKLTGWGKKSQKKWESLVAYLQSEGSSIEVSDIGNNRNGYFYNAEVFSKNSFRKLKDDKLKSIEEPLEYINEKYDPVMHEIDSLTSSSNPVYTSSMLDKMVEAENQIRAKAESFLNNSDLFSYPPLKPSNENEIGTIKHTIYSAFVKVENIAATVFSLFLSLIIDLAALLYILVFIPYNGTTSKKGRINNGPRSI